MERRNSCSKLNSLSKSPGRGFGVAIVGLQLARFSELIHVGNRCYDCDRAASSQLGPTHPDCRAVLIQIVALYRAERRRALAHAVMAPLVC
jgi:hypothetical protein